jgi:uncharacterized protein YaaQ
MGMKLVIAIVQNDDADDLIDSLTAADYRATRLASTGGFLRQGNTTIIVGVPEESVDDVLNIVANHGHNPAHGAAGFVAHNPFPTPTTVTLNKAGQPDHHTGDKTDTQTARATVFVLNLEKYERI